VPACFLALLLVAAAGKPLHYWGSRAPVITLEVARGQGVAAQVEEVHAALDGGSLVVRFTFDRAVAQALYLPDGKPVSGRVGAVLYLDADGDRASGYDAGAADLRTGADYSLEIGVLALGEDPEEERKAEAVVTAVLYSLEGRRRRTVWRGDDQATPEAISIYGEWIDLRLPAGTVAPKPGARIAIAAGGRSADGRLLP
jgi:hypothetical protein